MFVLKSSSVPVISFEAVKLEVLMTLVCSFWSSASEEFVEFLSGSVFATVYGSVVVCLDQMKVFLVNILSQSFLFVGLLVGVFFFPHSAGF